MNYQFDWSPIISQPWLWIAAISTTLIYAVVTTAVGFLLGMLLGLVSLSGSKLVNAPLFVYVQVFRCTPLLVQIIWFYYALPILTGYTIPSWAAAGLGLTLYSGAFATEIFRAGVMSIEKGQWQAASALGMTYPQMLRHIILIQAVQRMIPPLVSQAILAVKNTSLLYIVAVPDLMYVAQIITSQSYRPLEAFTFVALVYLIILYPLTALSRRLEKRNDQ
jgi:polar amino acid transport system permease protein